MVISSIISIFSNRAIIKINKFFQIDRKLPVLYRRYAAKNTQVHICISDLLNIKSLWALEKSLNSFDLKFDIKSW